MIYKIEDVRFDKNKIILNKNNKELQINIKDIYTMFYAKWSWRNYFSLAYTRCVNLGILYIATKEMKKLSEVIHIRISLEDLKKFPSAFYKKIQFLEEVDFPDILRLNIF